LKDDATFAIRIPTANSLPETAEALVAAIAQSDMVRAGRAITQASTTDFVSIMGPRQNAESVIKAFEEKVNALKMSHAYRLFEAGEVGGAERLLLELIDD